MDGTHGSTDEERIYHSAGTSSGQHVDDREFRRLIEEAGFMPVRRNSTYERFAFDWMPPRRTTNPWPCPNRWEHSVLRCGRINYTNDLPIYCAFDEGAIAFPGTLVADVPARLNAALLGGTLDLSPVSAYFYAAHADELALMPRPVHRFARRGLVGHPGQPAAARGARRRAHRRDDRVGERA